MRRKDADAIIASKLAVTIVTTRILNTSICCAAGQHAHAGLYTTDEQNTDCIVLLSAHNKKTAQRSVVRPRRQKVS